jgi:mannose-6-phosphate isomerase-like protein (cupin superfamily)
MEPGMTPQIERVVTEPRWFIHYLTRVHVSNEATEGAFSLIEMSAKRFDSPLHIHHHESETFFVLDGVLHVHVPGQSVELRAGDAYHTPLGVPQMYQVVSDSARWLVLTAPGGFDEHIVGQSEPAERDEIPTRDYVGQGPLPDKDALRKRGHEILGPPGTMPDAVGATAR